MAQIISDVLANVLAPAPSYPVTQAGGGAHFAALFGASLEGAYGHPAGQRETSGAGWPLAGAGSADGQVGPRRSAGYSEFSLRLETPWADGAWGGGQARGLAAQYVPARPGAAATPEVEADPRLHSEARLEAALARLASGDATVSAAAAEEPAGPVEGDASPSAVDALGWPMLAMVVPDTGRLNHDLAREAAGTAASLAPGRASSGLSGAADRLDPLGYPDSTAYRQVAAAPNVGPGLAQGLAMPAPAMAADRSIGLAVPSSGPAVTTPANSAIPTQSMAMTPPAALAIPTRSMAMTPPANSAIPTQSMAMTPPAALAASMSRLAMAAADSPALPSSTEFLSAAGMAPVLEAYPGLADELRALGKNMPGLPERGQNLPAFGLTGSSAQDSRAVAVMQSEVPGVGWNGLDLARLAPRSHAEPVAQERAVGDASSREGLPGVGQSRDAASAMPNDGSLPVTVESAVVESNQALASMESVTSAPSPGVDAPLPSHNTLAVPGQEWASGATKADPLSGRPAMSQMALPMGHAQWSGEFGDKLVLLSSRGEQVAELVLNPPSMGSVDVRLNLSGSEAGAQFYSPHPAVREAIEAALPRLREMLADAGLSLGETLVSSEPFQQHQGEAHADSSGHGRRGAPAPEPAESESLARLPRAASSGGVDLFV